MPHIHTGAVSESSSHFRSTVICALKTYKKRTMVDLLAHPLAEKLQACDSSGAVQVLRRLQEQVQVHERSRCSHERLTRCLEPTVNVLYTFSMALEGGVDLDISLATPILAGVGVLLLTARNVRAGYNTIADVLEYIVYFFRRLELYSEVSPTNEMKNIIAKMLAEVLSILAIATAEIKRCRLKRWLKKLTRRKSRIEDALRRLDKLTRDEARMSTSQVLKAIIRSMNEPEDTDESVPELVYDGKDAKVAMQETVNDADETKRSSSTKLIRPHDTVCASGEKDDSPPRYSPRPPAYETSEKGSLLLEHGAMVETKDNKDETTLDRL